MGTNRGVGRAPGWQGMVTRFKSSARVGRERGANQAVGMDVIGLMGVTGTIKFGWACDRRRRTEGAAVEMYEKVTCKRSRVRCKSRSGLIGRLNRTFLKRETSG
jgi:hypothetical protein